MPKFSVIEGGGKGPPDRNSGAARYHLKQASVPKCGVAGTSLQAGDNWRRKHEDSPSRAEAIRRLCRIGAVCQRNKQDKALSGRLTT